MSFGNNSLITVLLLLLISGGQNMLAILLREVGYFVLLNLRPGNKVLN